MIFYRYTTVQHYVYKKPYTKNKLIFVKFIQRYMFEKIRYIVLNE